MEEASHGAMSLMRCTERDSPCRCCPIACIRRGWHLVGGGFGAASVQFGAQVAHVERLEVVTPAGDLVVCSPEVESDLFNAVRAGQGQFGVITRAWLRLRRCASRVRHYLLRYMDMERLFEDIESMYAASRFDHIRFEFRPQLGDALLRVGVEYNPPASSPLAFIIGLGALERHLSSIWTISDAPDSCRTICSLARALLSLARLVSSLG